MAALQHVHVPGYAALILRCDLQRLRLSGGLIPRSHEWLTNTDATWNDRDRRWTFPTAGEPSSISFGYLKNSKDAYRYGSSEYQYIAFDELTEFSEVDYLFLFSRLRRSGENTAPLRVRSASNPGNSGHGWVKNRFVVPGLPDEEGQTPDVLWNGSTAYVPARIRDNPAINEDEYRDSLSYLPMVRREQMMNGDWDIAEDGLLQAQWIRRYISSGQMLHVLDKNDQEIATIDQRSCYRFATVDPAGTSAERARERRGRPPSWSVIAVWDQPQGPLGHFLLLRHIWRRRVGFDQLCHGLQQIADGWTPKRILIENEKLGRAACDVLERTLPIECVSTGGEDKVVRAAPLINRLERGEIFLPKYDNDWLPDLESEWLAWTGLPDEVSDQVDVAAYAAMHTQRSDHRAVRIERPFA